MCKDCRAPTPKAWRKASRVANGSAVRSAAFNYVEIDEFEAAF